MPRCRRHDCGRRSSRSAATVGALFALALVVSCGGGGATLPRGVIGEAAPPALSSAAGWKIDEQAADPVRLRIPAIDVDAPVDPLEVDQDGVLPAPGSDERTGWWLDGPEPGERGPSVIAGHIDSYRGPAVFFRLTDLDVGDRIFVDRADGTTAEFVTGRIEQHDKFAFPTEAVYGDRLDAQLRLITCGGEFDDEYRRYLDNIIVYAARAG
jgi:sortase (surface protein transpeptidase)